MSLEDELTKHLAEFAAAPLLFVGSGVSRRYLGIEDWLSLLRRFAAPLPRPFEYYMATADGDLPTTASLMSKDFHEVWWEKPEFEDLRTRYNESEVNQQSALKIAISDYVFESSAKLPTDGIEAEEIGRLRSATIDGVISTNWDLLLETLFPDYRVFVGQDDVLFNRPHGIGELYKIHGSCEQPNSLVLTHEDYGRFDGRNPYLAAKLLTFFVEHPVVFLGYSLTDRNVLSILGAVAQCLTRDNVAQLQDRLLFVEWSPAETTPTMSRVPFVTNGLTLPIISLQVPDFLDVFTALGSVKRKFPARLLRQLKEHVYDLVYTNDPTDRLRVQDIDADSDLSEIEVVFGVGAIPRDEAGEIGYRGVRRSDLVADVLDDTHRFDADAIVRMTLPELLKGATYVPVFKYLREAGLLGVGSALDEAALKVQLAAKRDRTTFFPPASYRQHRQELVDASYDIDGLVADRGEDYALLHIALLDPPKLDADALLRFLREHRDRFLENPQNSLEETEYIKLVCLYDCLAFGPELGDD